MQSSFMNMSTVLMLLTPMTVLTVQNAAIAQQPRQGRPMTLKVSDNKRFLVSDDGKPFFYLGDTAWELFHRLTREEADRYLATRARQGFTVIQAVVLAELDGLHTPNAYGDKPLDGDDPTRPNEAYFKHVDYIVNKAESLGLVVGMLPTWGDKWNKGEWGNGPEIFTTANARTYGEWLGHRYKAKPIIWILGGDRRVETDLHRAITGAMAEGLRAGDGGRHLITFHPTGGLTSASAFHDAPWLDFNMWQTGHSADTTVWDQIKSDLDRVPIKPVMDGEPLYEDHPIAFNRDRNGTSLAADVRKPLWWDLLSGACGYTYGNHSVWQMYAPNREPINGPLQFWYDALERPGANQMHHARTLLESRPQAPRIPDPSFVVSDTGAGGKKIVAARDEQGSYAFVYTPASRPIQVNTTTLSGTKFSALWFDPRTGKSTKIGDFARAANNRLTFTPPNEGENQDWVLVLDDAARNYPLPGK